MLSALWTRAACRLSGLLNLLGVLFTIAPIDSISGTSLNDSLRVLESSPQRLQFEIHLPIPQFSQEEINGEIYDVPRLAGFELIHQDGQPALPAAAYLIILPPIGEPAIRVATVAGQRFEAKKLLPSIVPRLVAETDSLVYEFSSLSPQVASNLEPVRLVETGWWRGFRLGRLQIIPLQVSTSGSAQFYSSINVTIDFPEMPARMAAPLSSEEGQVLRQTLNFPHAGNWRASNQTQQASRNIVQPQRDWRLPQDPDAFKISVDADGLYALNYEHLDSAGVPIERWQPASVHLWHLGLEVPLHFVGDADSLFETGERLFFFGKRRSGEASYYNDYGNENVYWLSHDDTPGLRMAKRQVNDDPAVPLSDYFFEKRHFEDDELYYHGDNSTELFTTAQLPGEGWIWRKLLAGEQFATPLSLQNTITNVPACSVTARVRGITVDPVKPNHRVQFLLNGNLIGEVVFADNQEVIFRGEFPSSFARVGNNGFVVKSAGGTGAAIDQIYFDWVEIGYWRAYVASDNFLPFRSGENAPPHARYLIYNLHNANIEIYDVARQQVLSGFAVNQYSPTQWSASFVDSLESASGNRGEYLALTPEALKTPLAITRNTPSNWHDTNNAADYIIITHGDFRAAAERLANHRRSAAGHGFRVAVAGVEDVDDEFNFGMPDPEAIRSFFRHAYENWMPPAPRYALLLGDASWDPKFNAKTSRKQNFILPFGNPVSDNRFVCFDGPGDFIPELFIGRLPVETAEQAEAIVDKIINYENDPTRPWHKNFTFLNGGVDGFEQQLFFGQSEGLINQYIAPGPVAGKPQRVYKNTPGRLIGELRSAILAAIDNGTLLLSFLGHAGSQTWELMLLSEDLYDLQNDGRLPFVASMSCHTARHANPDQDTFGETFLRLPARGAVAFWGTSGWGFVFQDGVLLDKMYSALAQDSVRAIGVLTTLAKIALWQQWGGSITNVSTIDHYSLLGDPALQLALPRGPELVIRPAQISFAPANPSEQTPQVNVKAIVRNYGLATIDSVALRLDAASTSQSELNEPLFADKLPPVGFSDSVQVSWHTSGHRGEYVIRASVDSDNKIAEVDENNNATHNTIYFFTNSITLASPAPLAQLNQSQPILAVYNPALPGSSTRTYFFEVDTVADFSSSFRVSSAAIAEGILQTAWQVPRPSSDGLYFWRSRASENNVASPWQTSSFRIATNKENGFAQFGREQFADAMFLQTQIDSAASVVSLAPDLSRALPLEVQSSGFEDGSRCYLIVNYQLTNASVQRRGHQILAVDPVTQAVIAGPRYFDTSASTVAADSLAMFIEALPPRTIVLTGIRDDGSLKMTERAHQALESLGSGLTRQVGFRDGWAMIGQKGLIPTRRETLEEIRWRGNGTAAVNFVHQPFHRSGAVQSMAIGPASAWKTLRWHVPPRREATNGTALAIDVYGRNQNETAWNLLQSNVTEDAALNGIDAKRFPFLQLAARLTDDDGLDTPQLVGWEVDYAGGAELAIGAATVRVEPDSVFAGETVAIDAEVYNLGASPVEAPVKFSFNHPDSGRVRFATANVNLAAGGSSEISARWERLGLRGRVDLFVEVDPENQIAESYELNNLATVPVYVIADTTAPELRLTFDGKSVMAGDHVAAQPLIACEVFDDLAISDTSQVSVLLDGIRVSHQSAGETLEIEPQSAGRLKARIVYRPLLSSGIHIIEFFVRDLSRNTGYVRAEAVVETDFRLSSVMNYPNPFAGETEFTYSLTQPAEMVGIKIFTLSGKLIRSFDNSPTAAGFNRLHWDGRDADGDELANGVYLYKISARREGRSEEVIQKCVVMR